MKSVDFRQKNKIKNKILCIGEILWDLLPGGAKPGGAPMNVALHLKKFGFDVRFAGRIGKDQMGRDLKRFLEKQGLETGLLQVDDKLPTSTVEVHLQANHQVSFEIVDNVAWDRIELTNELEKAANEADVIVYGTLASRHFFTRTTILNLLGYNNCLKLIDINLRAPYNSKEVVEDLLSKANIVKLNDDEIKVIAGWYNKKSDERGLARWFSEKYHSNIVCVTRGSSGALLYNHEEVLEHAGFKVNVKDTVGSGDAFLAGFLAKYLSGETLFKSLEYACATGALVATKEGGTPDYRNSEVLEIIK